MRRRTLLASLAGGTAMIAGCATDNSSDTFREAFNPTGYATVRPIDEPLIQQGLTAESEQYLHGRLFHPGDSLPVTDSPDATRFAEAVDTLSSDQFAVLTNLRTSGAAPAHLWPTPTGATWGDDGLRIQLERQTITTNLGSDEAVGVALTIYNYSGERPTDVNLVLPSRATLSVRT